MSTKHTNDEAPAPMTVEDVRRTVAAIEENSRTLGVETVHGWDANGSPVAERICVLRIDAKSPLAKLAHVTVEFCGHRWEPMHGWNGRYRCRDCGVLGYRKIVLGCNSGSRPDIGGVWKEALVVNGKVEQIAVYRCQHRAGGVRCTRGAVTRKKGKAQFCQEHRK